MHALPLLRAGLSSVQLLSNKQLRQAVDSLVTEDFNELGVRDRGRQIRQIVDDIIEVRRRQVLCRGLGGCVREQDMQLLTQ